MSFLTLQNLLTFLMKTKKRMSEMMVRVSTRIPQNSPVLALLQSRLYLLDSLSQSGGCLQSFRYISVKISPYLLSPVNMSVSLLPPEGPLPPGDLFPHDVQDGGAHEAVLYGAREQEGGAALQQLVQGLNGFSYRFMVLASELWADSIKSKSPVVCAGGRG